MSQPTTPQERLNDALREADFTTDMMETPWTTLIQVRYPKAGVIPANVGSMASKTRRIAKRLGMTVAIQRGWGALTVRVLNETVRTDPISGSAGGFVEQPDFETGSSGLGF